MAVTAFQSAILKKIARSRKDGGETYIAGGLALNHQLWRPRILSDIDIFNNSCEALGRSSSHDLARLFGRDMSVIGKHVKNVFAEGELPEEGYRQILPKNGKGRPETIFALDVIISVGYRVKSKEGVLFRQWATKCLKEIMLARLRRELVNEKANRRIDAVENRLTRVENGLEVIAQQLSEDPEPFLSKDRKMIGFNVD